MIAATLSELGQRQVNGDFQPEVNMASSSTYDDESPLRAFLLSIRNDDETNGVMKNQISTVNSDLLASQHFSRSQQKMDKSEQRLNMMRFEDDNKSILSFGFDEVVQGEEPHHGDTSSRVVPMSIEPDFFNQDDCNKEQLLMHESCPSFPKEILVNMEPTPVMTMSRKNYRNQRKGKLNLQSKEEAMESLLKSYHKLNNLMEKTASSRCLLLQQSEKNNKSSVPLMKSLSTSAFKTIVSSTNITSSISAASFQKIKTVPETYTTSDCINSTFDTPIEYRPQEQKKRRMIPSMDRNLLASLQRMSKASEDFRQVSISEAEPSESCSIKSLPSCGSLDSSFSESEQATQESSPPLVVEVSHENQVAPFGKKNMFLGDSMRSICFSSGMQSFDSLDSSSRLGNRRRVEQAVKAVSPSSRLGIAQSFQTRRKFRSFQALPTKIEQSSSSTELGMNTLFQSKRKFNSFQAPASKMYMSSLHPIHDQNIRVSGSTLMFRSQEKIGHNKKPEKISSSMKLKLRRELLRSNAKIGVQERFA